MKLFVSSAVMMMLFVFTAGAQQSEIFAPQGKAIRGYDPVAFFKVGQAVAGADSLAYTWKGVQWNFSSQNNLDSFKLHPEQYAPQFGGYCAYGMAQGHKAPTEVNTWTIENGRLYFNYNSKVKTLWDKDRAAMIEKAINNWPGIKNNP